MEPGNAMKRFEKVLDEVTSGRRSAGRVGFQVAGSIICFR